MSSGVLAECACGAAWGDVAAAVQGWGSDLAGDLAELQPIVTAIAFLATVAGVAVCLLVGFGLWHIVIRAKDQRRVW